MNENRESRVLRFELLERRSLLAGDLFAGDEITLELFGDGAEFDDLRQNVELRQTQEVRTIVNDQGRSFQKPTRPDEPGTGPNLVQNPQFNFASQAAVVLTPSQSQQTQRPSSAEAAFRPSPAAVDAALAAFAASELTETADAAVSSATETQPGLAKVQASGSPVASGIETNPRTLVPLTSNRSVASREPTEGLIELSPSDLDHPLANPQDDSHLPWQFDLGVLPQIRSVIERASVHRAEVTDAAIESWFSGSGGMIAVDQVLLPAIPVIAAFDWLDVQLESTLKLHRSLELIASGDAPPLSDVAIDAIMALLGEMAGSQVQPINSIHPSEISKFVFPTIAILTAAAIVARRKHKDSEPVASSTTRNKKLDMDIPG